MKGFSGIFIIIGILILVFLGFLFYMRYFSFQTPSTSSGQASTPYSYSGDPKYQYVKEKYNLSEQQLQILSTVDPEDNE